MSTSIHIYIQLIVAAALIILALRLFLKYQHTPSITYFAIMFLGLAALALITTVVIVSTNENTLLFATRLGYYVGILVFSMMLMFSWYYPIPSAKMPRRSELFWIIPLVFFLPFILMSSLSIRGIERSGSIVHEIAGAGFFAFPVLVMVFFVWSIWNLVAKLRSTQGEQRRNLKLVILALVLGAGSAILFDGILPLFGQPPRHYISDELSSVLIGVTAYIITRK